MPLATAASTSLFLREVIEEIKEQRHAEPTNRGLVKRLGRQTALLKTALTAGDKPEQIVQEAVQVATLAARIATEGDPAYRKYRWPYE